MSDYPDEGPLARELYSSKPAGGEQERDDAFLSAATTALERFEHLDVAQLKMLQMDAPELFLSLLGMKRAWDTPPGPAGLPRIPDSKYLFRREPPKFCKFPEFGEGWLVYGMDTHLQPGTDVAVTKFSDNEPTWITVTKILAERTVRHRPNSRQGPGTTRFVVADFVFLPTVREEDE